jgi:hypothetical protein
MCSAYTGVSLVVASLPGTSLLPVLVAWVVFVCVAPACAPLMHAPLKCAALGHAPLVCPPLVLAAALVLAALVLAGGGTVLLLLVDPVSAVTSAGAGSCAGI